MRRGAALGPVGAVLFDRDGTLVVDVPYNGDPDRVELMPTAREAVATLDAHRVTTAVVTNQSGLGRGLLAPEDVHAVHRAIDLALGSSRPWFVCPHAPDDRCGCRKPRPGLILRAAAFLRVPVTSCVVVGDIGADVEAARAAGARAVLVPNEVTLPGEIEAAPAVASTLADAVDLVLREEAWIDRRWGRAARCAPA